MGFIMRYNLKYLITKIFELYLFNIFQIGVLGFMVKLSKNVSLAHCFKVIQILFYFNLFSQDNLDKLHTVSR